MAQIADIFIIGAGPAGVRAASILADAGKSVTLVGNALGGAYCSEGGVASNALLHFSSSYNKYKDIDSALIQGHDPLGKLDFKRLQKYVENMESKVSKLFAETIRNENITFLEGRAKFLSPLSATVTDKNGKESIHKFKKCLIATGAANQKLPIAIGKKVLGTSSFGSITSIPSSVSIIGGGFIGIEIAVFFARLGSKINIVESRERVLFNVDSTIVKKFEDVIKKRDVSFYVGKEPTKIERIGQKWLIFFDDISIESEEIFVCVGRTPDTENLALQEAGIDTVNGIPVFDDKLRTTNENIYVAGDVTNILRQSSWAYYSATVAAGNILGEKTKYNLFSCPSVLATEPAIALIGLSEDSAKKMGYDIGIVKSNCGDIYSFPYSLGNQTFIKAVYEKKSKTFLGAEAIGPDAKEVIDIFALVIQAGLSPIDTKRSFYSSAIFNEFFGEAMEKMK